ncbi:MAG TPA: pyridoxal-phosphate dependent enzyme [Polyangiaceae bacterium]|nr:pyridoxal-phosphate dependent enzyme [Polyangiaceae bacterium]
MRCIATPADTALAWLSAAERAALEGVRHLSTRFPDARLREVPLVRAFELDAQADPGGATRVWLALEALQVTGSFKVRGALVSVAANRSRGHVVAASADNHGLAVAYAARVLDVPATICVPRRASPPRRAKLRSYGAELVITHSDHDHDAEALAKEIAATQGAAFVSASDDLDVVRGSGASLGFEIVRALGGVPERVLAPVGSGGLATGLSWALWAEAGAPLHGERCVWGVEAEAQCAVAAAFEGGPLGDPGRGGAREPGPPLTAEGFARARAALAGVLVLPEGDIRAAMVHAHRDMGLVLEWRAAAALAPVLRGLPPPLRGGDVVVVLTGRNIEPQHADAVLDRTGDGGL